MLRSKGSRGVVLFTVLVVAMLLAIMATTVTYHSTQSLQRSRLVQDRLDSEMAAVAGLQDALSRLRANSAYSASIPVTSVASSKGDYRVDLTRNDTAVAIAAADGTQIPAGAVYLYVEGRAAGTAHRVATALALRPTSNSPALGLNANLLLRDGSVLDGWDSSAGLYSGATQRPVDLTTNTVANGGVLLRDTSVLKGNVKIGVGGVVSSVIDVRNSASYTGSASVAASSLTIPSHVAPFPPGATQVDINTGSLTISPGPFDRIRLRGDAELTLTPGVYVLNDVQLQDTSKLHCSGAVTLYCSGSCKVMGDAQVNPGGLLSDLKFYSTSSSGGRLELFNQSRVRAQAEGASLSLGTYDTSEFFGTFLGESMDTWQTSKVHIDTSAGGVAVGPPGAWVLRGVRYF